MSNASWLITPSIVQFYHEQKDFGFIHSQQNHHAADTDCTDIWGSYDILASCAVEDALKLLSKGQKNRKVMATNMNTDSSRSHMIFRVKVEGVCRGAHKSVTHSMHATLDLVDLAGSERQEKSGVSTGVGKREAISINLGLSQLGVVIRQVRHNLISFLSFHRTFGQYCLFPNPSNSTELRGEAVVETI